MTLARRIVLLGGFIAAEIAAYIAIRSLMPPETQFVLDTTVRLIGLPFLWRWMWRLFTPHAHEDTRA